MLIVFLLDCLQDPGFSLRKELGCGQTQLVKLQILNHIWFPIILCTLFTWTNSYVAEFGLFLWTIAGITSKLWRGTGPCPGPETSATGWRTQAPRWPFIPSAVHCNQSSSGSRICEHRQQSTSLRQHQLVLSPCWLTSLEMRKLKPLSSNSTAAEQWSLPVWQRSVELGNTVLDTQYGRDFQKCR